MGVNQRIYNFRSWHTSLLAAIKLRPSAVKCIAQHGDPRTPPGHLRSRMTGARFRR